MTDISENRLRRRNRLRNKILLPFFISIILLGATASIGSIIFIHQTIAQSIDNQLLASQEYFYNEIKGRENLLSEYSKLLPFFSNDVSADSKGANNSTNLLLEHFYTTLNDNDILLSTFPKISNNNLYFKPIQDLFSQVVRSGQAKFRYFSQSGPVPTLAIAAPFVSDQGTTGIHFLQTPMDKKYLERLGSTFLYDITLLSADGKQLVSNNDKLSIPELSPEQLIFIENGGHLYLTDDHFLSSRYLFHAVPLGTSDMLILAISVKLTDLDTILQTIALRSILTLLAALVLGGIIFMKVINKLMHPIDDLLKATSEVRNGNLDYCIDEKSEDEFGLLSESFNDMTNNLRTLYDDKLQRQNELAIASEQLKHQQVLNNKNREIEKTNRLLQTHVTELTALFQLNQAMISTIDTKQLFEKIIETLHETLNCDMVVLLAYQEADNCLEVVSCRGVDQDQIDNVSLRLDEGITGLAARKQKLIYVKDMDEESKNLNYKGKLKTRGAMVSVPLQVKKCTHGVLNLHKNRKDSFADNDLKLIQAAANQAAMALENAKLYEQSRILSYTDELTQLANRRYFFDVMKREMAQSIRFNSPLSLVMIDIDYFKQLNDTHGHLMGDRVLKKVARLLSEHTREADVVGRYGGEEFIILMPHTELSGAVNLSEKLRKLVNCESFENLEQTQPNGALTLSLGVTQIIDSDHEDLQHAINRADKALYLAKRSGRNRTETLDNDAS